MANNTGSSGISAALAQSLNNNGAAAKSKSNADVSKNEFLTMLIAQLKNQDPESPLDSKEFAVQLAQFTQVEKLVEISGKLDRGNDISAYAGFLGQDVVLDGSNITVSGGHAGQIQLNLQSAASEVKLDLLNSNGDVVGTKSLGPQGAGKQAIDLQAVGVPDGTYGLKVSAVNANGTGSFTPAVSISGTVTGLVAGADPKLIVNGREISVSDVKEVMAASKPAA